ncbi:MAG: diguanylate cyclase [Burkholderiaceae bacterium]|nr:diguanylate cyclase [Burkholderiaceae bacterium]
MRKFSLKYQLVFPFVLLVLLVPLTVGWMLFEAGSTAVNTLTRRVLTDVALRIGTVTDQHLNAALSTLDALEPEARAQTTKRVAPIDLALMEKRIWSVSRFYPEAGNYTYFGGTDGRFVGVYRVNGYLTELYWRPSGTAMRQVYSVSRPGERATILRTDAFDPRARPWYAPAVRQNAPVWSSVYNDFTSGKPTITVSRAVRQAGTPVGVVAVDVELKALHDYLGSLAVSKNGVAYVIDRNGKMVACSGSEMPFVSRDRQEERLRADEMKSPVIRASWSKVLEWRNGTPAGSSEPLMMTLESRFGEVEVAAAIVGEKQGLDWVAVVAAPRADFLSGVTSSFVSSAVVAAVCIMLALALGMVIINRVVRDIYLLNSAAQKIGIGEPVKDLDIHRQDEIGQLARTFNEMEHNLRTDRLTGAYNREFLFTRIRFLREKWQPSSDQAAFALLFIDLDKFKQINDQFGHNAGDRTLITLVDRLKAATRGTDTVVRYGGDEFVVLLADVGNIEQVDAAMEKIRAVAEQPIAFEQEKITIGISVGWALFPQDGNDVETLLNTADARMFEAKKIRS